MTKHKLITGILDVFIGVCFLIFFISLGLTIAIHFRPLYYMNIDSYSKSTSISYEIIKENYDALIDYCNPFYTGELDFPSLPSSNEGISHFAEVKNIFNVFFALIFILPIILAILIFIQHKRKVSSYLLTSPIIMCVAPILAAILCLIDFDATFTLFHKIIFNNENWYFDPITDPVILILPLDFFLQCAIVLIISVLIGCIILVTLYFYTKHHTANRHII